MMFYQPNATNISMVKDRKKIYEPNSLDMRRSPFAQLLKRTQSSGSVVLFMEAILHIDSSNRGFSC